MAEYIEREAGCKDCICYEMCAYVRANGDERVLKNSPCKHFQNKADVAEVVRCKECNQWKRNSGFVDSPNGHCFYHSIDTNGYDFCSYGAKMDGKGEGANG